MDFPKDISSLYRKMNISINALLNPLGLSSAKAMFLFCIYDHEQMTQVEICRELVMDKSSVAKMLTRLEKDGLIIKTINPADVRSFLVSLTEKAIPLVPQAREIQERWLDNVTSGLTEVERNIFYELMRKVSLAANSMD